MNQEYTICKMDSMVASFENVWANVETMKIKHYPWNTNESVPELRSSVLGISEKQTNLYKTVTYIPENYVPKMYAKMFYTQDKMSIFMYVYEKYPRATYHNINDPVCRDSCLEFFFQPCPEEDDRYFNFEFNPWGTYLLGIGHGRHDLVIIDERISTGLFSVKSGIEKTCINKETMYFWRIEFSIPFSFINKFIKSFKPYSGKIMRGNFYKCGDDTLYPHYGCWNKVINDAPDFHRPECFGKLIMV